MRNIAKINELDRSDHEHMQYTLFGEKPSFEDIVNAMTRLGKEIDAI